VFFHSSDHAWRIPITRPTGISTRIKLEKGMVVMDSFIFQTITLLDREIILPSSQFARQQDHFP
jgi:hypothetical protein